MYKFTKAHALKNDFVIFDSVSFDQIAYKAEFIADRKNGIGCDQVICINDRFVKFWNADGSVAKFCGNGSRCAARYLKEKGEISFLTDSGTVLAVVKGNSVRICYPSAPKIIEACAEYYKINVGNNHIVVFGDKKVTDWKSIIAKYPNQNYNIMHLCGNWMDAYELGSGPTQSCGSGAMACAVAISEKFKSKRPVTINSNGGSLLIEFEQNKFYQTGDTEFVFTGEIDL